MNRTVIRYVICSLHLLGILFCQMPIAVSAEESTREGTFVHPHVRVHWKIGRSKEYLEFTGNVRNCSGGVLLNMEISTHLYPVRETEQGVARFVFLPHAVPMDALLPFGMRIALMDDNPARQLMVSIYYERQDSEGNGFPVMESYLVDIPPESVLEQSGPET